MEVKRNGRGLGVGSHSECLLQNMRFLHNNINTQLTEAITFMCVHIIIMCVCVCTCCTHSSMCIYICT